MKILKENYLVLIVVCVAAFASVADSDQSVIIKCESKDVFPTPQCQTSVETSKVKLTTELGASGDQIKFEEAKKLVVEVSGPSDSGDLDKIEVITQGELLNNGSPALSRNGGTVVLTPAELPSSELRQKDAIVIVAKNALVKELVVNTAAQVVGQKGGNVVVVADGIGKVTVAADGYHGKDGKPAMLHLAEAAMANDVSKVAPKIKDAYLARRESDASLPLEFDAIDINSYEASGLNCRADEKPYGRPNTNAYAFDNAAQGADLAVIASPMEIIAAGREQSKRAFCSRDPEVALRQSCEAEKEYSFQAICRIKTEAKSVRFFKRDSVRWKRALCKASLNALMRRSIIRKARIQIDIPGKKSFLGLVEQRVWFRDASHVYLKNVTNPEEPEPAPRKYRYNPTVSGVPSGNQLTWYSPFFRQDVQLGNSAKIKFGDNGSTLETSNGYNDPVYPGKVTGDNRKAGAKLMYQIRGAAEDPLIPLVDSEEERSTLYYFKDDDINTKWDVPTANVALKPLGLYDSYGCMPVISASASSGGVAGNTIFTSFKNNPGTEINAANAKQAILYFQAMDVNGLGFTESDLLEASVIRASGCQVFEVTEAIVAGEVEPANWVLDFGDVDADTASTRPECTDTKTTDCDYPTRQTPEKSEESICPESVEDLLGYETFLQYEGDDTCYVTDPRDPPTWLKRLKAVQLNRPVTGLNDTGFSDLQEGSALDRGITAADFNASELASSQWTKLSDPSLSVLALLDKTKKFKDTPRILAGEFSFPTSVSVAEINSLSQNELEDFCVTVPDGVAPENYFYTSGLTSQVLVRSTRIQKMIMPTGKDIAVSSNEVKKTCPAGIRLDLFVAHASRPTCPTGTATKLKMSRWSSIEGNPNWKTMTGHELAGDFNAAAIAEANYTTRSEALVTRYDDLPTRILTRQTHEVHPSLSIGAQNSYTGAKFPPDYGFTSTVQGVESRKYEGWAREKTLFNSSGAGVAPDSFTPFKGVTLFDRGKEWCNAPAYETLPDGTVAPSFGAKGILRDAPKRMFEFNLSFTGSGASGKYVGTEIISYDDAKKAGFYGLNNQKNSIFKNQLDPGKLILNTDLRPEILQGSMDIDAFRHYNYPNLGSRILESCLPDEHYNEFGGFCHVAGSPTESRRRVVERIMADGRREPWRLFLSPQNLLVESDLSGVISKIDRAFYPNGLALTSYGPAGALTDSITVEIDPRHFMRLGFMRSMNSMFNESRGVSSDIALNRPESLGKMMLSPGFAGGRASYCNQKFFMVAVPVPLATTVGAGGQTVSVPVDRNNFLLGSYTAAPANVYLPPVFVALQVTCSQDLAAATLSGTIVGLSEGPSKTVLTYNTSPQDLWIDSADYSRNSDTPVRILFRNSSEDPQVIMTGITETLIAGINATTGSEDLEFLEIASPETRNRSAEWVAAGVSPGNDGQVTGPSWQSILSTESTAPSTQQDSTPKSCTKEGLRGGEFFKNGANITLNGTSDDSIECRSVGGEGCALTAEELSLFTKTVLNSKEVIVTRPAMAQFTPWSHEIAVSAPKNLNFAASSEFGNWSPTGSGRPEASVPGCQIYNANNDAAINRLTYVSALMNADGLIKTPSPDGFTPGGDFISYPVDPDLRKSRSCLRWDSVTGNRCELFGSTVVSDNAEGVPGIIGTVGSELQPLGFGGQWRHVYTETKERVARDCAQFQKDAAGKLLSECQETFFDYDESLARDLCTPAVLTAPLCRACQSVGYPAAGALELCAPKMLVKGEARREQCTDTTCVFPMNVQSLQVEASKVVSGASGEDGTSAGSATIFCRDCGQVDFTAIAGRGGRGSTPVASTRSKVLTCLSWNNNPINPVFSVRNLWSQPYIGGTTGKTGRTGEENGDLQYFSDLSPEMLFLMGHSEFWLGK